METYDIGGSGYDDFESFGRRCGCPRPSYVRVRQVDVKMREFRGANAAYRSTPGTIDIPIQFIHLTSGAEGAVDAQQRSDQVGVLNSAFGEHAITFTYEEEEVKVVDDADWFQMGHGSAAERAAKSALQVDPETTLNVYTTNGGGLLGWATFPWELEGDPDMDGVVVLYSSLPNIGRRPTTWARRPLTRSVTGSVSFIPSKAAARLPATTSGTLLPTVGRTTERRPLGSDTTRATPGTRPRSRIT